MCRNCAFSKDDKPSDSKECAVCIRNPKLLSGKAKNLSYGGRKLERPIDMYISREFFDILIKRVFKLEKQVRDLLSKTSSPFRWDSSSFSYRTTSFDDPFTYYIPTVTSVKVKKNKGRKGGKKSETKKLSSN